MEFDLGTAIGGLLGGAGAAAGTAVSARAAEKATEKQIAWERERATHAHQWEVQDLKAAGLNPILSAGGSGAATGGISAVMPDFSGITNIGSQIGTTIQAISQAKNQNADTALKTAEVQNTDADTRNKGLMQFNIEADTILKREQAGMITKQQAKTELETAYQKIQNKFAPEILESTRQKNYASATQTSAAAQKEREVAVQVNRTIKKIDVEIKTMKRKLKNPENNPTYQYLKEIQQELREWTNTLLPW